MKRKNIAFKAKYNGKAIFIDLAFCFDSDLDDHTELLKNGLYTSEFFSIVELGIIE